MEPMKKVMKILVMSDTHDQHEVINIQKLPKADIFIHCGDFTKHSLDKELTNFRRFLKKLPYKHKIVIAGNHDYVLNRQKYPQFQKTRHKDVKPPLVSEDEIAKLKQVCIYLEHQLVEVQGLRIFGSPWGFMYNKHSKKKDIQRIFSLIPPNIDIFITHQPPFGILDCNFGCKTLLTFVEIIRPQLHLFGHIHQGYGAKKVNGINFVNAANLLSGKWKNNPFLIEITPKYQSIKNLTFKNEKLQNKSIENKNLQLLSLQQALNQTVLNYHTGKQEQKNTKITKLLQKQ